MSIQTGKGAKTWGNYSTPAGTQKVQENVNTFDIRPQQEVYIQSPSFYQSFQGEGNNDTGLPALRKIQSGDFSQVRAQIQRDYPNLQVMWLRVSWADCILTTLPAPLFGYGYQLVGAKYEMVLKNNAQVVAGTNTHTFITNVGLSGTVILPLMDPITAVIVLIIFLSTITVLAYFFWEPAQALVWAILKPIQAGSDALSKVFSNFGEWIDNNPIATPILIGLGVFAVGVGALLIMGVGLRAKSGNTVIDVTGRTPAKTSLNAGYGKAKISGAV